MAAPRTTRLLAAVLALALLAGACERGDGAAERSPATTVTTVTTTPEAQPCPVGDGVAAAAGGERLDPLPPVAGEAPPDGTGLVVGTLLPRTGDLSFLGPAPVIGVELGVADVDAAGGVLGAAVTLVHADSAEGDPATADAEIDRLLAAGVHATIGPLSSAVAATALDRAPGAVLVTPGATASALDRLDRLGHLFRTSVAEDLQGRALAELVLDDGLRRVDVVARGDEHGRTVADAFADALVAGGGEVASRLDRDPAAEPPDTSQLEGEGTVVIGLADSATVIEALEAEGRGPRDHPTYGTDGNLGPRLGDLVTDRRSLACMRGLLPVAPVDGELASRIASRAGVDVDELDPSALDHAAEAYDAVVIVALAAEVAGTLEAAALAGAIRAVTRGGTPCDRPAPCLELARAGTDFAYVGRSGGTRLDDVGNRTRATFTLVAFDADGRLARLGGRDAGAPPAG